MGRMLSSDAGSLDWRTRVVRESLRAFRGHAAARRDVSTAILDWQTGRVGYSVVWSKLLEASNWKRTVLHDAQNC